MTPSTPLPEQQQVMVNQQRSKPIDLNKLLTPKPKPPAINPLDFRKYEGMPINQIAQPIIWEVQEKINEIIRRINEL